MRRSSTGCEGANHANAHRRRGAPTTARSHSSLGPQHVTDASDGVDQPGFAFALRLAPEITDEDLERVARRLGLPAPHPVHDDVARKRTFGVAQEELEQCELGAGQVDVAVTAVDDPAAR